MTVGGHPAPIGDVGSAAFDVADRLAIINLFGAYAYTYDANRLDAFRALFTESPERCYAQVFAVKDGGPPTPDLTGCYDFTAVKQRGAWRFSRWVVAIDQTQPQDAE